MKIFCIQCRYNTTSPSDPRDSNLPLSIASVVALSFMLAFFSAFSRRALLSNLDFNCSKDAVKGFQIVIVSVTMLFLFWWTIFRRETDKMVILVIGMYLLVFGSPFLFSADYFSIPSYRNRIVRRQVERKYKPSEALAKGKPWKLINIWRELSQRLISEVLLETDQHMERMLSQRCIPWLVFMETILCYNFLLGSASEGQTIYILCLHPLRVVLTILIMLIICFNWEPAYHVGDRISSSSKSNCQY